MKFGKLVLLFTAFFLLTQQNAFSLQSSVTGEKMARTGDILKENTSVQEFFRSLDVENALLFNSVLQANYVAGYYSELLRFSDSVHYAEVSAYLETVEKCLRALKGDKYRSLLGQAEGKYLVHLVRFVIGRREAGMIHGRSLGMRKWVNKSSPTISVKLGIGADAYWGTLFFGEIYTPPIRGHQYRLEATDVFPPYVHFVHKATPKSKKTKRSKNSMFDLSSITAADVGKIFFISLFSVLAVVLIIALIGASCYPNAPIFRKMRILLE